MLEKQAKKQNRPAQDNEAEQESYLLFEDDGLHLPPQPEPNAFSD